MPNRPPLVSTSMESVTRFHGLTGDSLIIDGIAYEKQDRCQVRWAGNCSQVAYGITEDCAQIVCRLHAKQAERLDRKVVRINLAAPGAKP